MQNTYTVTVEINIPVASSPEAAALKALEIIREDGMSLIYYVLEDETGITHTVDLDLLSRGEEEETVTVFATYVSVWDGGVEITSDCIYNPIEKDVYDIEMVEAEGLNHLEDEYILLADGTRIDRDDFTFNGEPNE